MNKLFYSILAASISFNIQSQMLENLRLATEASKAFGPIKTMLFFGATAGVLKYQYDRNKYRTEEVNQSQDNTNDPKKKCTLSDRVSDAVLGTGFLALVASVTKGSISETTEKMAWLFIPALLSLRMGFSKPVKELTDNFFFLKCPNGCKNNDICQDCAVRRGAIGLSVLFSGIGLAEFIKSQCI